MSKSPWFLSRPRGPVRLRMFCFSHAGGNAGSYMPWQGRLDASVEVVGVQLPGRGARLREPLLTDVPTAVARIAEVFPFDDPLPFVLFGHSLGALLAFELARHASRHGKPVPLALIASGCDAPQFGNRGGDIHQLHGDALVAALARYNGAPPELLAHRELMELMAPTIRADFAMATHYRYEPGPPLDIPIVVLNGRGDAEIEHEHLGEWQRETRLPCRQHLFEGDHFFIHSNEAAVLERLDRELKACQPA